MTQPAWPIYAVPDVPYPEMVIRSRRELSTRDTANARNFEIWQTTPKYLANDRPDLNQQRPFQDFAPISSRMNERNYTNQPRYDADSAVADSKNLSQNAYFNKYDPSYDNRNAVRELQSVVYEDKSGEGIPQSQHLLRRNFDNRWISGVEIDKITQARLILRPSMDDIRKIYWSKDDK